MYLEFETYTAHDSCPSVENSRLAYSFKDELTKLRSLKRYIPPFGIGRTRQLTSSCILSWLQMLLYS